MKLLVSDLMVEELVSDPMVEQLVSDPMVAMRRHWRVCVSMKLMVSDPMVEELVSDPMAATEAWHREPPALRPATVSTDHRRRRLRAHSYTPSYRFAACSHELFSSMPRSRKIAQLRGSPYVVSARSMASMK